MNDKLTEIVILQDRSGSMWDIWSDVQGGLEGFLEPQKDAEGDANVSLILFDSQNPSEVVIDVEDVKTAKVNLEAYGPRGGTPLLDAMFAAINRTGERLNAIAEEDRPGKVVFVVYTDGEENQSTEIDHAGLKAKVKEQEEKYDWDFIFLGADMDAFGEGGRAGFSMATTAAIGKGKTADSYVVTSKHLASYRSTGIKGDLGYTDDERESLK